METTGIAHLGLAVAKLDETAAFFIDCLGWNLAREVPEYPAKFVTNGNAFLTLWQTDADAIPFDRKANVGLHHVAIRVTNESDLEPLFKKTSTFAGVNIYFAPVSLGDGPAKHFMVFEPSGIRVEFIWTP